MPPIYCDDMYAIKNNDNHETCHHDFNFQLDYANQVSHDSYFIEFAPTIMNEKKFAYVESNNFFILVDHERNAFCDTYIIKSSDDYIYKTCHNYDYPFTEHYSFNVETIYSIRVSYDTPTPIDEKKFAYVESNKNSMLVDHENNALCDILLNSFMILLKIIMRGNICL